MSALDTGIVEWVNTFELSSPCSALSDLSDGVMLSEILLEISPDLFNIENIRRDVRHNWALKQTNLKKLLFHIETFYRENLRQNTEFSSSIDLLGVARNSSPEGIRGLVQLLVGAAVSCNEKADFIEAMMQMSDNGQTVMQQIVQESMAGMQVTKGWEAEEEEHGGSDGAMSRSGREREEMSSGMGGARGMGGRGHPPSKGRGRGTSPLARSVSSEQREEEWALRLAEAEESIAALAKERDEESSSRGGLEKEVENLKEKLDEMEAHALARNARDEEATNMSLSLQRLLNSLEEKEEDLQQALQKTSVMELKLDQETEMRMDKELELRKLADELDMAKAKASQFAKMEATLEKYQRRFEEMEDLQLQNKQLDELNTKYLDQMLKLESTAKTIPNLKKKIEQYKNQAVELERQNFEVTSALALKDADIQRLREELEAATQARNFFEDELIALRDQNKAHAEVLEEDASMDITGGMFAGAASRAEIKEKVARQEQEIALLKAQIADGGVEGGDGLSRVDVLESQLELARRVKDERSAEALAAKRNAADLEQKNHKLEQVVAELRGAPQSAAQAEKSSTKIREMKEEMERLRGLAQDRERLRMTAQSLEDRLKQRETQVNNLQTDKEKLESYTKETLHTFQDKYMVAIAHCKMQLAEKNEKIDYLESKITRDKAASKREERLLMSTVYELGMDTIEKQLRSSVTELVRGVETDSSWIRKQRAQLKRTNPLAPP